MCAFSVGWLQKRNLFCAGEHKLAGITKLATSDTFLPADCAKSSVPQVTCSTYVIMMIH